MTTPGAGAGSWFSCERPIRDLLNNWREVNLFTRPRRFGKTLCMSMLRHFFETGADKALFDGLAISKEAGLCEAYMGKFPVGDADGIGKRLTVILGKMISVLDTRAPDLMPPPKGAGTDQGAPVR